MPITVTYINPPIPDRAHDYHAHFDWQDADALTCEGYGSTAESAVFELLQDAAETDGDGSEQETLGELAWLGWRHTAGDLKHADLRRLGKWLDIMIYVSKKMEAEEESGTAVLCHSVSAGAFERVKAEIARMAE
jgi:hypothetical protein